ncbi:unnamed protein product [Caenorhabditis nigoni]
MANVDDREAMANNTIHVASMFFHHKDEMWWWFKWLPKDNLDVRISAYESDSFELTMSSEVVNRIELMVRDAVSSKVD